MHSLKHDTNLSLACCENALSCVFFLFKLNLIWAVLGPADVGDIQSRLLDHRPVINAEIRYFVKEFEVLHMELWCDTEALNTVTMTMTIF